MNSLFCLSSLPYRRAGRAVCNLAKKDQLTKQVSEGKLRSKFDRLQIDGRAAASATSESGTAARICSAMFDVGGGVILVDVSEFRNQGLDECGEALKVAQVIAPRMPR
ncbi:hypothetical protein A8926_2451 [Saccharopolyspora spinosa]|uniref:Uncharacterized protein n=2 Tax=Saccharopolyspora spinosa TaxID=60894 RepID=A0A2N3XVW4_SACSN|nr:hypothetical protein A8926_2451 [Saccharopolyspora spinosa]